MQVQASMLSLLSFTLLLAGSAQSAIALQQSSAPPYSRSDSARAAHVLNRLTFGPRPGDLERVLSVGVNRWISEQLAPLSINDSVSNAFFAAIPANPASRTPLLFVVAGELRPKVVVANAKTPAVEKTLKVVMIDSMTKMIDMRKDSAVKLRLDRVIRIRSAPGSDKVAVGRVASNETSERQLLEVITDFWHNHFSVFNGKTPSADAILKYDREVIRPNALGNFRELLGAVARSPMMMWYLDNHLSSADTSRLTLPEYSRLQSGGRLPNHRATRPGLNENYARELLELHTLGVDGGYTQQDVIEVARAFTGWSVRRSADSASFAFAPDRHDAEEKLVLGQTLAGGRGLEDGEDVLDLIAKHPSTAKYIARKLVVRLVSDDPPASLVERAAAEFTRTNGNIAEVVRTIVTSEEFFAPSAYRAKIRSPYEFLLAMKRAMDVTPDASTASTVLLRELSMSPWGKDTPDGWPETGSAWMSSGAMFKRVGVAMRVAAGDVPVISPDSSATWRALADADFQQQLDAVVRIVFAGNVSAETRAVLESVGAQPREGQRGGLTNEPRNGRSRLTDLLTTAFSAPEFQRR